MKKTALLLLAAIIMSGCAATTNQPTTWSTDPIIKGKAFELGFRDDGVMVWREVVKVEASVHVEVPEVVE